MYNETEKEIEKLMINYPEYLDRVNLLNEQRIMIYNCSWEDGELDCILKEDGDILDGIEQDTAFYEDVRNIQDMLIQSQKDVFCEGEK